MEPPNTASQNSYDPVAQEYAARFYHELDQKPFDQQILDLLTEKVDGRGMICDLGCGPGQIARYLSDHGAEACGIDFSGEMVKQAHALNPEIAFRQGDMLALTDIEDNAYGGIAAFYSIIHVPRPSVVAALREMRRVLMPDGVLLLTFHIGDQITHLDEWMGKQVSLDFFFFETDEMTGDLETAGFELEEVIQREPYPDEVQTRRAYLFAKKPR